MSILPLEVGVQKDSIEELLISGAAHSAALGREAASDHTVDPIGVELQSAERLPLQSKNLHLCLSLLSHFLHPF